MKCLNDVGVNDYDRDMRTRSLSARYQQLIENSTRFSRFPSLKEGALARKQSQKLHDNKSSKE